MRHESVKSMRIRMISWYDYLNSSPCPETGDYESDVNSDSYYGRLKTTRFEILTLARQWTCTQDQPWRISSGLLFAACYTCHSSRAMRTSILPL